MMDMGGSAASATPRDLSLRSFLLSPLDPATWRAVLAVLLGIGITGLAFNALFAIWSIGGSLLVVLVGIPIIGFGVELCRFFARAERWRMEVVDGEPMRAHAYRRVDWTPAEPFGAWLRQYAEGQFLDVNRWRDVVYVLIGFPLAVIEFVVVVVLWAAVVGLLIGTLVLIGPWPVGGEAVPAIAPVVTAVLGLALLPVAAFVTRGVMLLHRVIVDTLLCVSQAEALRQETVRLRESRSAAVELEASELRRIERDLHDGAQQRLVMMAMDLGRAEEKIDSDPTAAKQLVADARQQSRMALAELRDLVRGTAPSILADRGLVAAVASIAGRGSVPTVIDSRRIEGLRFSPAVERAGYFAAAEALTNVAKHSDATRSDVIFWRDSSNLYVEVWDNGRGGATFGAGGGLAGLRDRAATLDGTVQLVSPPGGPTMVRVALPLREGRMTGGTATK
jgi:signal transduction histidine kinase